MQSDSSKIIRRTKGDAEGMRDLHRRTSDMLPSRSLGGMRTTSRKRRDGGVIAGNVFWSEEVRAASPFGNRPTAIAGKRNRKRR